LKPNGEYWLKDEVVLRERLDRHDEAFRNARRVADACTLDLAAIGPGGRGPQARSGGALHGHSTGGQPLGEKAQMAGKERLPGFATPDGQTAFNFLYSLCQDGAKQ